MMDRHSHNRIHVAEYFRTWKAECYVILFQEFTSKRLAADDRRELWKLFRV